MRSPKLKVASQIVLLLASTVVFAAPLFESEEPLDLELRGPLREVITARRDREARPFELVAGEDVLSIQVRARGHSRIRLCDFPPLRLDFTGSHADDTVFAGQQKLKLVSHCKARSRYEDNVIEEYAAYRIFSLLSDASFKARLLRVRYVDTSRPSAEPLLRYGFVIESLDALAERIGGTPVQQEALVKSSLDRSQLALVFVFQYLIGNTDWSLVAARGEDSCCHNGELLEQGGRIFYVPYDFDFAGLVNARYAKPRPEMGIATVKSRRYRGYCLDGLDLEAAIRVTLDREAAILEELEELPGAASKAGRERIRYVSRYFDEARDVEALAGRFERACIG